MRRMQVCAAARVLSRPSHPRRLSFRAMRPLLTLLMLALAGCATGASLENCVCPLPTVPPLSLPHVQRVATLDPVLQGIPARPGPGQQGIAAYPLNPAAPSGAHAPLRALLSIEGMLYALDLTAHSVQVVPTPGFVCRTPALSPD